MNTLPPRRTMPDDVRTRLRERVAADLSDAAGNHRSARWRAPLAVAAGVAVLAVGAVVVVDRQDDGSPQVGTPPTSTTSSPEAPVTGQPVPAPPTLAPDDPLVTEALDRCGAVVEASPREREFPPRDVWEPVYGVQLPGRLIVAYKEGGGKPGFCDTTDSTATVSDPSAETMDLGTPAAVPGRVGYSYYGLYLSEGGLLAGVAQTVTSLTFAVETSSGTRAPEPVLRNEAFVVEVGELADGDRIFATITVDDPDGARVETAVLEFDPTMVRPVGATGVDRP